MLRYNSREVGYSSSLLFLYRWDDIFPQASFDIFYLSFLFNSLKIICLVIDIFFLVFSCLVFSKLSRSVVWCLNLIGGNSRPLLFQVFFLSFSLFLILVFPLYMCYTMSHHWPTVLGYWFCCCLFSVFFLFALWCSRILLIYLVVHRCFPVCY